MPNAVQPTKLARIKGTSRAGIRIVAKPTPAAVVDPQTMMRNEYMNVDELIEVRGWW